MEYLDSFRSEMSLITNYGANSAFIVWSMGLYLNTSDLNQLATDCLTDCPGDKKIDFLRIDTEQNILYIAQGYYTNAEKEVAPANKASDLNTAIAWLTDGEINAFPANLKNLITDARNAIQDGSINQVKLIYLHNCGESKQVQEELATASTHMENSLADHSINVNYVELGNRALNRLFLNQAANIVVTEDVECPFEISYEESSDNWDAAIMTVNGTWLRNLFNQYHGDLFSANYRSYLGTARKYINTGIKLSAERSSKNFWAFNNGISILTQGYEKQAGKTVLHGISIINGAQTTGSLGMLPATINLDEVKVLTRIIQCTTPELISDIVKFNNTQNRINSWDSYGNDPLQSELKRQFAELSHEYICKRGFENHASLLSIEICIQPLLAFLGKYKDANRSKTAVFESRTLYAEAFDRVKARHVLFVCCLNTCLQEIKAENKAKILSSTTAKSDTDKRIYDMFASIRSSFFVLAIIGELLPKLNNTLSDKKEICLTPDYAKADKKTYQEIVAKMKSLVSLMVTQIASYDAANSFISHYSDAGNVAVIANKIESDITSLKYSVPQVENIINDFMTFTCNG